MRPLLSVGFALYVDKSHVKRAKTSGDQTTLHHGTTLLDANSRPSLQILWICVPLDTRYRSCVTWFLFITVYKYFMGVTSWHDTKVITWKLLLTIIPKWMFIRHALIMLHWTLGRIWGPIRDIQNHIEWHMSWTDSYWIEKYVRFYTSCFSSQHNINNPVQCESQYIPNTSCHLWTLCIDSGIGYDLAHVCHH